MRYKRERGQLLLEVLIALTVLGLVAVAVVRVSTRSIKGVRLSGDRQEALNFAGQVMVDVEKEKTDDVILFFTGANGVEDCGPLGSNGEYDCQVTYIFDSPPDSNSVEVNVVIEWLEGDNTSSVSIDRVFTKTRL